MMLPSRLKTAPYDAADYIRNKSDIVEYLRVAFEDGSSDVLAQSFGVAARAQSRMSNRKKALPASAWLKSLGITITFPPPAESAAH